jgi:hypothetical protein
MRITLLMGLVILQFVVQAQNSKKEIINPESLAFRELPLFAQRIAPAEIKLPFASIKIIDSRFDTTKFGFVPVVNFIPDKRNVFRKLRFKGGVANPVQEYYNDYYKNSFQQNGFELLIVMKRFWLSGIDNSRDKRIALTNSLEAGTNFYLKWEYYIGKNGKYLPVRRTDTLMHMDDDETRYVTENFDERKLGGIKFFLKAMIELYNFDNKIAAFDNLPGKTMEQILEFNNKRNEIKVLKDSILKKGVYLNFDEFKNNAPSINDFKEEKTRYQVFKSERYLSDPQGNLINEYWGYSDGEDFRYGKYGNDKIYRVGQTFEFFVQVNNVAPDNSTPVTTKNKIKVWYPYQIDMETGQVY